MVALLKTAITTAVLVAQLSSAIAVKREDAGPTTLVGHHFAIGSLPTGLPLPDYNAAVEKRNAHIRRHKVKTTTSTTTTPTSTTAVAAVAKAAATSAATTWWKPAAGTTWQIEIGSTVSDLTYSAAVFDVDLFDTPTATITTLKANGKKVICYFSAGSYEDWRSDASSFTAADKGSAMDGWAGEWWLQTNSANVRSIMTARIQLALTKGCDGVDPDNVDGYNNDNGLGLTTADAVNYMTYLASAAHTRGLAIGLKNAGEIVGSVLPIMDWEVNEQCLQYTECATFRPFITAGKPVFHIEYPDGAPTVSAAAKAAICNDSSRAGFSTDLKELALNAWVETC